MDFHAAMTRLGEHAANFTALGSNWDELQADYPEVGPDFLEDPAWRAARDFGGLEPELDKPLTDLARALRDEPALARLAWQLHRRLFGPGPRLQGTTALPKLQAALGTRCGLFYLFVGISLHRPLLEAHRPLGLDEALSRACASQLASYCENYRHGHTGRPGICRNQMYWLSHYSDARLFRLGRMEYYLSTLETELGHVARFYRHRRTRQVLALAEDGIDFTAEGERPGPVAENREEAPVWTARLDIGPDAVIGHPIDPASSRARRQPIRLDPADWRPEADADTIVLSTHIPSGGGLTPERFQDSLRRAFEFFPRHFPDRAPRAATCRSWIVAPVLRQLLPASSNLVRNLEQCYLLPMQTVAPHEGLWTLFCQPDGRFDPATAPAQNSVQRAVLDHLRAGGAWRHGGMVFFAEELPRFGQTPYHNAPREQAAVLQDRSDRYV